VANLYPAGSPTSWSWINIPNADVSAVAKIPQASQFSGYPLTIGTDVPHDTPTGIGFTAYPIHLGVDTNSSISSLTVTSQLIVSPTTTALPTPSASLAGQIYILSGGGTAATKIYVCTLNSKNAYEWTQIGMST
jgi:hypothetical protein